MSEIKAIDLSDDIQSQVRVAYEQKTPLRIQGGNSKSFYGNPIAGQVLDISEHQGVTSYEPSELVISARAGTPLNVLEKVLDEHNQMLAFEPPAFADTATIGGTIACNLSGPRRAYNGAARDLLLGTKIINGKGEFLSFGGEVMKNVAGYDVSRLMAGAMGTLGVIMDVSLKILPKPEIESTQVLSLGTAEAIERIHQWSRQPLPISASCIYNGQLYVRLSGTDSGVQAAITTIGGEVLDNSALFWQQIKEHQHEFFQWDDHEQVSLWRLSLLSNAPELQLDTDTLYEWGGALRWLKSSESEETIRKTVNTFQGHATLFRSAYTDSGREVHIFQPLPESLLKLHMNLKRSFDPEGILNPGRMYPEL